VKVIALLLSLLVLGSIGAPCDDEAEHKDQIEFSDEHDDHEHEEENCSPFCSCQCCHSNTYQPQLIALYKINESKLLQAALATLSNEDWVFKEIQPPRQFSI